LVCSCLVANWLASSYTNTNDLFGIWYNRRGEPRIQDLPKWGMDHGKLIYNGGQGLPLKLKSFCPFS